MVERPQYRGSEEVDAVVVGTGAGGAPLMARLAMAGMRVVALEAGPHWRPARDFATDERAQTKLFWNDERLSAGGNPLRFGNNNSGIGVGGSTLHYTAYVPRPQPDDLRLRSETGVGEDWPLDYHGLEPYYGYLEQLLGVSGPSPYPWGPPAPLTLSRRFHSTGRASSCSVAAPHSASALPPHQMPPYRLRTSSRESAGGRRARTAGSARPAAAPARRQAWT